MNFLKKILNVKDNSKYAELEKKAEELVPLVKIMVIGFQVHTLQKFPQLKNASRLKYWNLYCTVAATYSALMRVGTFIRDRDIQDKLDKIVLANLKKFDPNAPSAFNDLENFFCKIIEQNTETLTTDHCIAACGLWIVWNLTDKNPIEDEKGLSFFLGNIFFTEFANYFDPRFY